MAHGKTSERETNHDGPLSVPTGPRGVSRGWSEAKPVESDGSVSFFFLPRLGNGDRPIPPPASGRVWKLSILSTDSAASVLRRTSASSAATFRRPFRTDGSRYCPTGRVDQCVVPLGLGISCRPWSRRSRGGLQIFRPWRGFVGRTTCVAPDGAGYPLPPLVPPLTRAGYKSSAPGGASYGEPHLSSLWDERQRQRTATDGADIGGGDGQDGIRPCVAAGRQETGCAHVAGAMNMVPARSNVVKRGMQWGGHRLFSSVVSSLPNVQPRSHRDGKVERTASPRA